MLDAREPGRLGETRAKPRNWPQLRDLAGQGGASGTSALTAERATGVELPTSARALKPMVRPAPDTTYGTHGVPTPANVSTPDAVLRGAARAAADSLGPITAAAREVAEAFRQRELGPAQAHLTNLFRTLRALTLVTNRLATKAAEANGCTGTPEALYSRLTQLLDDLGQRQQSEDWDGVAGLLAVDLDALLADWPVTLRLFADRAFTTDRVAESAVLSERRS